MPDTSSPVSPQPATPRGVHTLTVNQVEALLKQAEVQRSRRHVLRMCQSGMLQAIKIPGPTGEEWYVDPTSVTKAIGDLKQLDEQRARRAAPQPAMSSALAVEMTNTTFPDKTGHTAPQPVTPRHVAQEEPATPNYDAPRHPTPDLDVFEHPYVKRLEMENDRLQSKLDNQVRRTEEIQTNHRKELIELHRMTAVGQSETLANFMLKAKDWLVGGAGERNGDVQPPAAS